VGFHTPCAVGCELICRFFTLKQTKAACQGALLSKWPTQLAAQASHSSVSASDARHQWATQVHHGRCYFMLRTSPHLLAVLRPPELRSQTLCS